MKIYSETLDKKVRCTLVLASIEDLMAIKKKTLQI